MTTVVRRAATLRWALVGGAAAVLCALPSVVAARSGASPTAADPAAAGALRTAVLASATVPYRGYAETSAQLGLPKIPRFDDVVSLLDGTTHVRAWSAGPDRNRVAVLTAAGEHDTYLTPDGEYSWDYGANLTTLVVGAIPVRLPRAGDLLPPDLARRVLSTAGNDPVSPLPARRVAGITAPGIRIRPADPATTIGQVDIWADHDSGLPVRVEVTARGATTPVLTSQFLDLERTVPNPAELAPTVPPGSGFSQAKAPDVVGALGTLGGVVLPRTLAGLPAQPALPGLPAIGRYGAGLTTFVALPLPRGVADQAIGSAQSAGGLNIPIPGLPGARAVLIKIPLLSVGIVQARGRRSYVLAGLIDGAVIQQAVTELATGIGPGPRR